MARNNQMEEEKIRYETKGSIVKTKVKKILSDHKAPHPTAAGAAAALLLSMALVCPAGQTNIVFPCPPRALEWSLEVA